MPKQPVTQVGKLLRTFGDAYFISQQDIARHGGPSRRKLTNLSRGAQKPLSKETERQKLAEQIGKAVIVAYNQGSWQEELVEETTIKQFKKALDTDFQQANTPEAFGNQAPR
jgi:transcriptional regulator